MTDLHLHLKKPVYVTTAYVSTAWITGIAAVYQPVLSIFGVALLLLLAVTVHNPARISYPVLLSTAISVNYIIDADVFGIEIISLYKLGILVLLIPCMLQNGIRLKFVYPILTFAAMLFLTFFLGMAPETKRFFVAESFYRTRAAVRLSADPVEEGDGAAAYSNHLPASSGKRCSRTRPSARTSVFFP